MSQVTTHPRVSQSRRQRVANAFTEEIERPLAFSQEGAITLSLLAEEPGKLRFWIMTDHEAYRLTMRYSGPYGTSWSVVKWSDGTRYEIFERYCGEWSCTCKGHQAYGSDCNSGNGCRHVQMVKSLRDLAEPRL